MTRRHKGTNVGSPTARKKKDTKVMRTADVTTIAHRRDIAGTPTTWTYVASILEFEELHPVTFVSWWLYDFVFWWLYDFVFE
jgi:hypothetical protein